MFAKCKQEIKSFWKFELPFIDFFISVWFAFMITKVTLYVFSAENITFFFKWFICMIFLFSILFMMYYEARQKLKKKE
jgi:hypothetical protein